MNKSEVMKITEQYNLAPNKKLGQNFLTDNLMTEKIIRSLDLCKDDNLLEIGPGLGALSEKLSERVKSLTLFEIDSGIVRYLKDRFNDKNNVEIIHGDFLKDSTDRGYSRVVSNLPYYCASEILFILGSNFRAGEIYVMVQKEMAQRITAKPGERIYGAMTVNLGLYFSSEKLFDVPHDVFYPKPEIVSSFLKMKRKDIVLKNENDIKLFHQVVRSAFWGRRKTLLRALSDSPHLDLERDRVAEILKNSGIDPSIRGENLSMNEFLKITENWDRI